MCFWYFRWNFSYFFSSLKLFKFLCLLLFISSFSLDLYIFAILFHKIFAYLELLKYIEMKLKYSGKLSMFERVNATVLILVASFHPIRQAEEPSEKKNWDASLVTFFRGSRSFILFLLSGKKICLARPKSNIKSISRSLWPIAKFVGFTSRCTNPILCTSWIAC